MLDAHPIAPLVRTFFEDHLRCRQNLSGNTIHSYRDALKLFLRFAAEKTKQAVTLLSVEDVTENLVLSFLSELETARGNSIQTRNQRLTALRRLFDFVAAREPLLLDHCRRIVTIPPKRGAEVPEIRYLEKPQITAILDAALKVEKRGRRDYALLLFMYNTGARAQEVVDTRVSWVTLTASPKVQLLGKGRKWRSCPLWEHTARHLKELIQYQPALATDGNLFLNRQGRPLSRSGIADIVQRYATKAAAIEPSLRGVRVTPHTLRHTTAMHLLQSGVELNVIRSWLGHASISTTNRYIEIDLAMKAKALQTCAPRCNQPDSPLWRSQPDILTWLESL
jgi:integrase/recombinase XerD